MALESAVKAAAAGAGVVEEFQHTPDDLVLVTDTNFLVRLSRRDVWAYQELLRTQSIARQKGKRWLWRAPAEVMSEYAYFYAKGTVDENYGVPLAMCSIKELFGDFSNLAFDIPAVSMSEASNAVPSLSDLADVKVLTFAAGLVRQGIEVYVASYDIKDVIAGVRRWNREHAAEGRKIEPLPPSQIKLGYFRETGLESKLSVVVTPEIISGLQTVRNTATSYHVVICEKEVTSGDAVFDAGVGIAEKRYFEQLRLPEKFRGIRDNFRTVPVMKVKSLGDISAGKRIRSFARSVDALRVMVVEESDPFSPVMVPLFGKSFPLFTAGLNFLYWQTNSAFAHSNDNYVPVARRTAAASRVSTPK